MKILFFLLFLNLFFQNKTEIHSLNTSFLTNNLFQENNQNESRNIQKILLIIPGLGNNQNRIKNTIKNLKYLKLFTNSSSSSSSTSTTSSSSIFIDCLIFIYQKSSYNYKHNSNNSHNSYASHSSNSYDESIHQSICQIEYFYHGNYAYYMKSVNPFFLFELQYTHVFILLDDVLLLDNFSLEEILSLMTRNNLSVVSPGIINATMTSTRPYQPTKALKNHRFGASLYKIGHSCEVIEIFATIFTLDAWKCWWNMLQPNLNPSGWGYDLCYTNLCPDLKLGVSEIQRATHKKLFGRLQENTTYLANQILSRMNPGEQRNYWINTINSMSKTNESLVCKDIERHSRGKPLI